MLGRNDSSSNAVFSSNFGKLLREIRNQKGLTLAHVSNSTGIAEETIRRIELDKFEPKLSTLEILSNYYRLDLIELISKRRNNNSMFSDTFISKINLLIINKDFIQIRAFAEDAIKELSEHNTQIDIAISTFLYAVKYMKFEPKVGHDDSISALESILVNLTPDNKNTKSCYPLPLELTCIVLLSILYRQNEKPEKSINLLNNSIERILSMPYINTRYSDYLATIYLNLSYAYHSMSEHDLVIKTVDASFSNLRIAYTKTSFSHLLFRKGLALHFKSDSLGYSLIRTALSLMDEKDRLHLEAVIKEKYDLIIQM